MGLRYISLIILFLVSCNSDTKKVSIGKIPITSLQRLKEGNERFVNGKSIHPNNSHKRITEVANHQNPFAIVVTCSDSRVSPELIYDQGLGDLFVIRTAGNILSDIELGSIEYAIEHLNTKLIVVMGHENCGAITAITENTTEEGHLAFLLNQIKLEQEVQQVSVTAPGRLNALVQANVKHVVHQLQSQQGIIGNHFKKSAIEIIGAEYYLQNGLVSFNN